MQLSLLQRVVAAALFLAAAMPFSPAPAEAKTTRTFSGSNPAEVEKNARRAGYTYPEGEMQCSGRCNQRWAKE